LPLAGSQRFGAMEICRPSNAMPETTSHTIVKPNVATRGALRIVGTLIATVAACLALTGQAAAQDYPQYWSPGTPYGLCQVNSVGTPSPDARSL
jgi:hypothetical protein